MESQMMGTLMATLSFIFIIAFSYLYVKDKDKRKLLFIIVFLFGGIGQIPLIIQGWNELQILPNLELWSGLTPISGIIITLVSAIIGEKDFKKSFKLFLTIASISGLIILMPLQINLANFQAYTALSMFMIGLATLLFIKHKTIPNLMFLLTTITYIIAEIGLNVQNLNPEIIVTSFTGAHIFMAHIFVSSKGENKYGIESFFRHESELEKTKKQLRKSQDKLQKSEKMAVIGQAATM